MWAACASLWVWGNLAWAQPNGTHPNGEPPVTGFIVRLQAEGATSGAANSATTSSGTDQRKRVLAVLNDRRAPLTSLTLGAPLAPDWHRVQSGPLTADAAQRTAAQLRADPRVLDVVPDVREQRMDVTPRDSRYADQWWLQAVAAGSTGVVGKTGVAGFTTAWSRSTGVANGAAVAVLDSGITSHPELNAHILPGYDFVSDAAYANDGNGRDNDPSDAGDAVTAADRAGDPARFSGCLDAPVSSWHGTTIAGQLAAVSDNTEGVAAINWNGQVLPVRVAGKCGAAVSDIIDGLRWAAGLAVAGVPLNPNPVRLVVLSYGGIDPCDANSASPDVAATARLYLDTLDELRRNGAGGKGTLVFAAAGNQRNAVGRPASCTGAFAVTSINREGFKANYANFGPQIALAATGGDAATAGSGAKCDELLADSGIVSTSNLGDTAPGAAGYAAASGTSFAAPMAAGVASLMLAIDPALTLPQIEDLLKRSARPHVATPQLGSCSLTDNPKNPGRCGCTAASCGAGILDADRALVLARDPAATLPTLAATTLFDSRLQTCAVTLGLDSASAPDPAASAPVVTPTDPTTPTTPTTPTEPAGGSGGGGSVSPAWLALLALAVMALVFTRTAADARSRPHQEKP